MKKVILLVSGLCVAFLSNAQWTGTSPLVTTSKVGIKNSAPSADLSIGTANTAGVTTNTSKILIEEDNPWIEMKDVSGYNSGGLNNGAQVGLKMQIPTTTAELTTYYSPITGSTTSLRNSSTGTGLHIYGNNIWLGQWGTTSNNELQVGMKSYFRNSTLFDTGDNQFKKIQTGYSNSVPSTVVFSANGSGTFSGELHVAGFTRVTSTANNDWSYGLNVTVNRDLTKAFTMTNTITNTENFVIWGNGVVNAKKIWAEGLTILATAIGTHWPDYVFEKSYTLKPLEEVEAFVNENKHLPEVPSAKEIEAEGIDAAKMDAALLKKIEELTLYMIEMNKTINELKKENQSLKQSIK